MDALFEGLQIESDMASRNEEIESESDISESDDEQTPDIVSAWSLTAGPRKVFEFTKQHGIVNCPGSNPMDYFNMIFNNEFLNNVVDNINSRAQEDSACFSDWRNVDVGEIKKFIGLVFRTGFVYCNPLHLWSKNPLITDPFSEYMAMDRFMDILNHFQCGNVDEPCGRLARLRPFIKHFNAIMKEVYYPGRDLTLDIPLLIYNDRLVNKTVFDRNYCGETFKFLHSLVDPSTGVFVRFDIPAKLGCSGHISNIPLLLMDGLLNAGHSLYVHKFYTSVRLAKKLLEAGTYCTGFVKSKGRGVPVELFKEVESTTLYSDGITLTKLVSGKCLLSTEFGNEVDEKNKLVALVKCREALQAIDLEENLGLAYPHISNTGWYQQMIFHILQIMFHNSYALFLKYSGQKMHAEAYKKAILQNIFGISYESSEDSYSEFSGSGSSYEFPFSLDEDSLSDDE